MPNLGRKGYFGEKGGVIIGAEDFFLRALICSREVTRGRRPGLGEDLPRERGEYLSSPGIVLKKSESSGRGKSRRSLRISLVPG